MLGHYTKHQDLFNIAALIATWLASIVIVHPTGNFPLNDDWVYALSVKSIIQTGHFRLLDWSQAIAVVHAYWGALFCWMLGFSFDTLRLSTLVLGLGGVLATYFLFRQLNIKPSFALMGAAIISVNPIYFCLSNSFMTDVPFYFLSVTSLGFMVRGFRNQSDLWLALGLSIGFIAILTRQFGFVLPLGFGAAYLWNKPRCLKTTIIAVTPLILQLTMYIWIQHWVSIHTDGSYGQQSNFLRNIHWRLREYKLGLFINPKQFMVLAYSGLFVLPLMLLNFYADIKRATLQQRYIIVAKLLFIIALLGVMINQSKNQLMPFSGNVLAYYGVGPLTLRDTFILHENLPSYTEILQIVWISVSCFTVLGCALVLEKGLRVGTEAWRKVRHGEKYYISHSAVLLSVSLAAYIALITIAAPYFFDRYLLFCFPYFIVFASFQFTDGGNIKLSASSINLSWLLVVVVWMFSIAAMHDYFAWNGQRWNATNDLTIRDGVKPAFIDGGYEFNGWYLSKPGGPNYGADKSWWWVEDDKYVIAMGPIPGYRQISSYPFTGWLFNRQSGIIVLEREQGHSRVEQ